MKILLKSLIFLPDIIFFTAHKLISKKAGGINKIIHSAPTTAENNPVVNSSPDLLYSACPFDVSNYPLKIKAFIPETYWSMSFYDRETNNFFTINRKTAYGKEIRVIVKGAHSRYRSSKNEIAVRSPSEKGLIIFRILVPTAGMMKKLQRIQAMASCESLAE